MSRPRLLDAFCCEGGAAIGYDRAGFDVIGVDIAPQPRYPFQFFQRDAIEFIRLHGHRFDAIHASPPCQAHSKIKAAHKNTDYAERHVDLIPETRAALMAVGVPWVIENVEGAPLRNPITLCGSSFGMRVRRHRLFESSVPLMSMPCQHGVVPSSEVVGLYGNFGPAKRGGAGGCTVDEARQIMEMPHASRYGIAQAIPPAYTEFIGRQLIDQLEAAA